MRILFDNNVPYPLRSALPEHTVRTAANLKWEELKNGDLLSAAEAAGFDLVITADQNLIYQQNLSDRRIALVVLGSNDWHIVRQHLDKITPAVEASATNSYAFVEMPLQPKPKWTP